MARGKFSPELLQKIRAAVNLVEVVGQHVVLRKTGRNHVGLCPFHGERTPSFSVSEDKQVYHCYGCKKGGDLFSFVMERFGLGFPEAVEELADKARVPLPSDWGGAADGEDPEAAKRRAAAREKLQTAYRLNRLVSMFYRENLRRLPEVERYFAHRGVVGDLSRDFYVGAALPGWDSLATFLEAKKAPLALAVELGLIKPSIRQGSRPGSSAYFDLFRNRATFPILNTLGRVVGFGGRLLPQESGSAEPSSEPGAPAPKYLNSSESLVFQKSRVAFGLYQAQKHLRERDEALVVEGYFDVAALHAGGFAHAISPCGTSLTPEHLAALRKLASKITLLFDGDQAGIAGTERAMETGLQAGLVLHGAVIPGGKDPDEILFDQETGERIAGGQEAMSAILAEAKPLLDARIEEQCAHAAIGFEERTQAIKKIAGWLSIFSDPVGREVRFDGVVSRLGIAPELLRRALGGGPGSREGQRSPPPQARVRQAPRASSRPAAKMTRRERILLEALFKGESETRVLSAAGSNLPPDVTMEALFEYPPAQDLIGTVLKGGGTLCEFQEKPEVWLNLVQDPQLRSILTEALVDAESGPEPALSDGNEIGLHRAVSESQRRVWASFLQRIKVAAAAAEASKDAGLHADLMKQCLDVRRKLEEFTNFYDEA